MGSKDSGREREVGDGEGRNGKWEGKNEEGKQPSTGMNRAREIKTRESETTYPALELRRAVLRDEVDQPMHPQVCLLLVKPQGLNVPEVGDEISPQLFLHESDLAVQLGHPGSHEEVALVGVFDPGAGKNEVGGVMVVVVERIDAVINCARRHGLEQRRKGPHGGGNAHGDVAGGESIDGGGTEGKRRRDAGSGGGGRNKIRCVILITNPSAKVKTKAE